MPSRKSESSTKGKTTAAKETPKGKPAERTAPVRSVVVRRGSAPSAAAQRGKKPVAVMAPRGFGQGARREFYRSVVEVLQDARKRAYRAVNFAMVEAYWHVGRMIVEEEQQGKDRADYGAFLIQNLSVRLKEEFGKGFDESNLWNFRLFYLRFGGESQQDDRKPKPDGTLAKVPSQILDALRRELTWTHYRLLMRVEDDRARQWYLNEAANEDWSTRVLERQIGTLYYERLLMSREKEPVVQEMLEKTAGVSRDPREFIKNPYVLEFLDIPDRPSFHESDLEKAIIDKLQAFLLELGKGFAFVARQQRVRTDGKGRPVDLVFYNYILKCFVLIDLKMGELTHGDVGQMDTYVRIYEDKKRAADDGPTVGIILCSSTDETIVKYSVLNGSSQIFASRYKILLPALEELREEVTRERAYVVREQKAQYQSRSEWGWKS